MKTKTSSRESGAKKDGLPPAVFYFISLGFFAAAITLLIYGPSTDATKFLIVLMAGLGVSAFVFGAMDSNGEFSGDWLAGKIRVGGPVVALVIVAGLYQLMAGSPNPPIEDNSGKDNNPTTAPDSPNVAGLPIEVIENGGTPESPSRPVKLKFSMYFNEDDAKFHKNRLIVTEPNSDRTALGPQSNDEGSPGKYVYGNVILPPEGQPFKAFIRRERAASSVAESERATICFHSKSYPENSVRFIEFEVQDGKQARFHIDHVPKWAVLCDIPPDSASSFWIRSAYADALDDSLGWIVPSLDTLKHRATDSSYTEFTVSSDRIPGVEKAEYFKYKIYSNGTPVYIDGLRPEETYTTWVRVGDSGFTFSFGLENLNFSGTNHGKEDIRVQFEFFSKENDSLKTIHLSRQYVALRHVSEENIQQDGASFSWGGRYVLREENDGFQVLILSSENGESIENAKKHFDERAPQRFHRKGFLAGDMKEPVAIVRPPLCGSGFYGLLVGFYDDDRRVRFTFSNKGAEEVLAWVRKELAPHDIASGDSYINQLDGEKCD